MKEGARRDTARFHRKPQRILSSNFIFLEENYLKMNETTRTMLIAPGEKLYVIVVNLFADAARFDISAALVGS